MKCFFLISTLLLFTLLSHAKIDLDFSKKRGLYKSSFTLLISADQPNTTIKYTTNGSIPSFNNGSTYFNGLNINTTTILRVFAYNNSDQSNVRTHSYIFYQDVPYQPNSKSGFPDTGFAFDASILNNGNFANLLNDALLQIGTISIAIDLNDFNNVYNGTSETPASAEFIIPSTGKHKQEDCGIERFGGTSFDSHKRNFRLSFKAIYGDEKMSFPLFDGDVINEFDQIALRAGHASCMNMEGTAFHTGESNDFADQVVRDLQINMSDDKVGVSGNFMHLYFNGIYWGVYNTTERPVDGWAKKYLGAEKEDYDVIKRKTNLKGSANDWNNMVNLATNYSLANSSNYQLMQDYMDVENFIDYVMLCNYSQHGDNNISGKNVYQTNNRNINSDFKFWIWDTEPGLGYEWPAVWSTDQTTGSRDFPELYNPLLNNTDFVMQTADQMHCHCFNNGALTPNRVTETYLKTYDNADIAMIAEAGRWATTSGYNGLVNARNRIVTNYLPAKTNQTINNYKNAGLYPNIAAVNFSQYGGVLNNGAVSLSNPNGYGTLYYTTDRTDPRASGGSTNSTAQIYNSNLGLPNGVYEVKARVKYGNTWSAMCPRKFYVGQNYSDLVINEIHYNPEDSIFYNQSIFSMDTVSGRNFEFVELKNTGTQNVYLEDVHFNKGITAKFEENTIIPPGGFIVIAEDAYWFQQKYGFAPDATYAGKLENSGENLWLLDPMDNLIDTLRYDDNLPWDTIPDNGQFSLALVDANFDNSVAPSWAAQKVAVTPKSENIFCNTTILGNAITADISCTNANDGFVSLNPSNGSPPYTYQWSNGSTNATVNSLSPNTYTVIISDKYFCETILTFTMVEPAILQTTSNFTNETYVAANDGTASVAVSGGTAPYSYTWSNEATTNSVANLSPGNYSVDVYDSNSCLTTETFTIDAIDCSNFSVTATATDETYAQANDGVATVTTTGGQAVYTYNWSNGTTTQNTNNLSPGTYSVTVTDAVGCNKLASVTLNASTVCAPSLIENTQPIIASGLYQVANFIKSNGKVGNSNNVSYKAGQYIELTDYFEVPANANFEAIIETCQ